MANSIRVFFEAVTGNFETDINRATKNSERDIKRMQRESERALANLRRSFVRVGVGLLAAVGGTQAIRSIARISDQYASLSGRLRLVTASTDEAAKVQERLFSISQETGQSFQATANLYVSLGQAASELGANQEQLLKFTKGVGDALIVSGRSAQEASGALLQLGQLIGGSVVQAQEFNSLIDGARPILVAVASGIERFGGSVAKLREEIKTGTFTSREFFDGFLAGSDDLAKQAQSLPRTVGQALQSISDSFEKAVSEGDFSSVVESLGDLNKTINDPGIQQGIARIVEGIAFATRQVIEFAAAVSDFFARLDRTSEISLNRRKEFIGLQVRLNPDNEFLKQQLDQIERDLNPGIQLTEGAAKALAEIGNGANQAIEPIENLGVALEGASESLKKAEKEAQSALNSLQNLEQSLRQEFETEGLEGAALLEYRLSVGDLSDELIKAGAAGKEAAEGALAYQRAIDEAAQVQAYFNELLEMDAEQLAEINNLRQKHDQLISGADQRTRQYLDTLADLHRLNELNAISSTELANATSRATEAFSESVDETGENLQRVTTFADEAARGIQQAFADFFFDPFDEGLKGLLENLQRTLDRAAAEILASQLSGFLFGNTAGSGGSGFGGGFFGSLLGLFGGGGVGTPGSSNFVGPIQPRASGGPIAAGVPYIVGERGPELRVFDSPGQIIPNDQLGGMSVTIQQSITVADGGTLSPRSRHQIANETAIGVQRALARHNGR